MLEVKGEKQEFFVWVSEHNLGCCFCLCIWSGILCWIYITYPLRFVGSLGSEGRTSAQRKNRAGCGHRVDCWLFAVPDKSDLLTRRLCEWGCLEHVWPWCDGHPSYLQVSDVIWLFAVLPCTDASGFPGILAAVETKSLAVWLWEPPVLQD